MLSTTSNGQYDLEIGEEKIEQVQQFRYLGIEMDPKLSYNNHTAKVSTKCRQAIGALCRTIRKWAPKAAFEKLYKITIEPILLYAIESWYPSQMVLQNTIERVKKFAAK